MVTAKFTKSYVNFTLMSGLEKKCSSGYTKFRTLFFSSFDSDSDFETDRLFSKVIGFSNLIYGLNSYFFAEGLNNGSSFFRFLEANT